MTPRKHREETESEMREDDENSPWPLGGGHCPVEASRAGETHWSCCFTGVGAQLCLPFSASSSPAEGHFWSICSWALKTLLSVQNQNGLYSWRKRPIVCMGRVCYGLWTVQCLGYRYICSKDALGIFQAGCLPLILPVGGPV